MLLGSTVQKSGGRTVMPATTQSYALAAVAGRARRTLGTVTVTVDATGCEAYEPLFKPRLTLQAALATQAVKKKGISLRSQPDVSFSPGSIQFSLRLEKSIDNRPDPSIDIDASFGLAVSDGALVATSETVTADVTVPWYVWLWGGIDPDVLLTLDIARVDAQTAGHAAIAGLVQLLNALAMPPAGKRNRTVRIDDGNSGDGIIEITACPSDLLTKFAAISEFAVLQ
jgi:hypothetical protein